MKLILLLVAFIGAVSAVSEKKMLSFLAQQLKQIEAHEISNKMLQHLKTDKDGKPVSITLLYESLCPFCRMFITEQLLPAFQRLKGTKVIKDVKMVPYGLAYTAKKPGQPRVFICDHGPEECRLNILQNCIIKQTNYQFEKFLPVIACMEDAYNPLVKAHKCIKKAKLNYGALKKCYNGKEGQHLLYMSSKVTDKYFASFKTKSRFVPFIIINGKFNEVWAGKAQKNLKHVLVKAYLGEKISSDLEMPPKTDAYVWTQ